MRALWRVGATTGLAGAAVGFLEAFFGADLVTGAFFGAAFFGAAFFGAAFFGDGFLRAAFLGSAFLGAALFGAIGVTFLASAAFEEVVAFLGAILLTGFEGGNQIKQCQRRKIGQLG